MSLTSQEVSNITYRGWGSITAQLVLLGFITGTVLLVFQYITPEIWGTEILGLLSGYIIRDGFTKAAEVYFNKKIANIPPAGAP